MLILYELLLLKLLGRVGCESNTSLYYPLNKKRMYVSAIRFDLVRRPAFATLCGKIGENLVRRKKGRGRPTDTHKPHLFDFNPYETTIA